MKAVVRITIGIGLLMCGRAVPARQDLASQPSTAPASVGESSELTGRTPTSPGPIGPEVRKGYAAAFRDLYEHLGKVYPSFAIKGIDWPKVGRELLPLRRGRTDGGAVRPAGRGAGGAAGG